MNRYEELKNRFQQEINAFPMKWAFSKEQFDRSMQERRRLSNCSAGEKKRWKQLLQ